MKKIIKDCPFCGSDKLVIIQDDNDSFRVACTDCEGQSAMAATADEACRFWNMRSPSSNWISFPEEDDPEVFQCVNCGGLSLLGDVKKGRCPRCGIEMDGGFRIDKNKAVHWWDFEMDDEQPHEKEV